MRAEGEFEREPRVRKLRAKKVRTPKGDQGAIKDFVKSRQGVEAYVEPRTLDQTLSVVLVATDGEWLRFKLPDDAWLRRFARKRAVPVYDAGLVGYPKRMREYRRGDDAPQS